MAQYMSDEQECKLVEEAMLDAMRKNIKKKLQKYIEISMDQIVEDTVKDVAEDVRIAAAKAPADFSRWDNMHIRIFLNNKEI